jgi:MFS family permease
MMGALIYISFFVQGVEGIAPTYAGYVTMPMSITMVVMSTVIGRMITKSGKYKRYALLGMPIMVAGMLIMAFMDSVWLAVAAMITFGIGLGVGMPVFSLTVQNAVSPADLGVATASSQLFRNLGGTIGIAVLGTVMSTSLSSNLKEKMAQSGAAAAQLDEETRSHLSALMDPNMLLDQPKLKEVIASFPANVQPIAEQVVNALKDALSSSLTVVFLWGTAIVAVAGVLTVFLREIPLRTSNRLPQEGADKERSAELHPAR